MFGGVGTAVALGVAVAEAGEQVQLVMTDYGQSIDDATVRDLILRHVATQRRDARAQPYRAGDP